MDSEQRSEKTESQVKISEHPYQKKAGAQEGALPFFFGSRIAWGQNFRGQGSPELLNRSGDQSVVNVRSGLGAHKELCAAGDHLVEARRSGGLVIGIAAIGGG